MKKYVSIILIPLLLATLLFILTGCGNEKAEENNATNSSTQEEKPNSKKEVNVEELKEQQKVSVTSVKVEKVNSYASKQGYELSANVVNNSEEIVKDYYLDFLAFDKNYLPTKMVTNQFSNLSEAPYTIACKNTEANIMPGESSDVDYAWRSYSDNAEYVIACVKLVTFFNGETWENPYYKYWKEKYENKILPEEDRSL